MLWQPVITCHSPERRSLLHSSKLSTPPTMSCRKQERPAWGRSVQPPVLVLLYLLVFLSNVHASKCSKPKCVIFKFSKRPQTILYSRWFQALFCIFTSIRLESWDPCYIIHSKCNSLWATDIDQSKCGLIMFLCIPEVAICSSLLLLSHNWSISGPTFSTGRTGTPTER